MVKMNKMVKGNRTKKGVKGESSQYVTRSNAIRRLQLTLQDFRRLCILKGVYPREPKKKLKGSDKTYFHIKDLKILEHDTLLQKFRDIKAHLKKYKKMQGLKQFKAAEALQEEGPKYTLGHVIRERYPSFIDALKDMDDALCLISLFANFPQHHTLEISNKDIQMCQRLYAEWMTYCTISQAFKKCFFSIKGIYFQVEIMGQHITWISPYPFNQRLPFDIDYKVIGTFKEFYVALLKFMNFKLYSDLGMQYPPAAAKIGEFLDTAEIRKCQAIATKKFDEQMNMSLEELGFSEEFKNTPEILALTKKQQEMRRQRKLFAKCRFLFNREVGSSAMNCLQYVVMSFGGTFYSHDAYDADEEGIYKEVTHHVMDRPMPQSLMSKTAAKQKEFIQPQYIADSINNLFLLPTAQYKPGMPPPPHLSPFIDNQTEGYVPMRQKEIMHLKGEEVVDDEEESEKEEEVVAPAKKEVKSTKKEKSAKDAKVEDKPMKGDKQKGDADSSSDNEEESEAEQPDAHKIKAERNKANAKLKKDLEQETKEMAKTLMTNRQRKLYQKAQQEIDSKQDNVKKLRAKRKIIEKKK